MHFVVINIPGDIMPIERGERFEDPLLDALADEGIGGDVVGGGSSLDEIDGRTVVTSCDIELEVDDLDRALPVIRRVLIAGGAPADTTIRRFEPDDAVYPLHDPG
jgi:hypothetical protein